MNILFDLNHPAHVHLFRNAIKALKAKGHNITVVARKKEVTEQLLNLYDIDFIVLSKIRSGLLGLAFELITRQIRLIPIIIKNKIDLCISMTGASSIHILKLFCIPTLVFNDSENNDLQNAITVPFAHKIFTPDCYWRDYGSKHHKYAGYHELAYLHPNRFTPDPTIFDKIKTMQGDKFFVLRFVAWKASHDIKEHGFSLAEKVKLVEYLKQYGDIYITSEKTIEKELEQYQLKLSPDKLHDLLYYATIVIADSQTVTTESALLGTPAIRYNSRVGPKDEGNFVELEKRYDLIYCFNNFDKAFEKVKELLKNDTLKIDWQKKREVLLEDKIDVTDFMVDAILNFKKKDPAK
ncbi:MAG: DUF354 domain-containing protein [Candidatus Omnitrophica bacterium]|nr:DUF354 domain-containing protein [Candidatus Omnitrophota bacterium]MBU1997381.1 DUF354 domain-containing protein [Candidatus Omnitrophota bacterium]MBU4334284.1 DUF354 domain-containing protein [Candidatus Omnitrophota bacterium]